MSNLDGKVAVVTGAASKRGMGHAVAVRLAEEGADVVAMDKFASPKSIWPGDEGWKGLDDVVKEVEALGRKGLALVADVSDSQAVDAAVAAAMQKFGRIDILVHCGGVRGPMTTPVTELDDETWKMVVDVNLTGSFYISRAVVRAMLPEAAGKKIILIGSMAAVKGYANSAAYCASKHGTAGLGKTLAQELAKHKINVNVINPGAFDTNLRDQAIVGRAKAQGISVEEAVAQEAKKSGPGPSIPLGRMGVPEDIADLVSFLVSDKAGYITGECILIGGGIN